MKKKNPQFSVSLDDARESGLCRMIIVLDSCDSVFCLIAVLLNEAPGFYSMGQLLFNKTPGLVRGSAFCPETVHVSCSNQNNDKHSPTVLMPVVVRSETWDCGFEFHGGAWMSVSCKCCVLLGGCLFDGPIARPEKPCCV